METTDRRYFPNQSFTVVERTDCGLGFVNPRPSLADIGIYYPPEYYEQGFNQHPEHHQRRYAQGARYLREIEERPGPHRLLDVGCANGEFPRFMASRGWNMEGVEVSSTAVSITDFRAFTQPSPKFPSIAPPMMA